MSSRKKKGKGKTVTALKLPKEVHDELRMTCALRGYSHIKCGFGKKLAQQQKELARFYHGQAPNYPSQIKLLAEGSYTYRDLYDEETLVVTNKKSDKSSSVQLFLKSVFVPDSTIRYRSGIDITGVDLEKTLRTTSLLLSGRKILEMARKGIRSYKKALSYCGHK